MLLRDGHILVAGGGNRCGTVFRTAALFDPSTNTWAATGTMDVAREFHSAALLGDGRVLVAGGVTSSPFPEVASAEIYDPATGTWTPVGSMGTARATSCNGYNQTYLATLPEGQVLAAGGVSGGNCYAVNPQRTVASLTAAPSSVHFSGIGQTNSLVVTAQMSGGSVQPFTGPLQFDSANTAVASVNSAGLITAVGEGQTQINVSADGLAPASVPTTVETRRLTSITVSPQSVTLIGQGQGQPLVSHS
jgi:hypothetical protein